MDEEKKQSVLNDFKALLTENEELLVKSETLELKCSERNKEITAQIVFIKGRIKNLEEVK